MAKPDAFQGSLTWNSPRARVSLQAAHDHLRAKRKTSIPCGRAIDQIEIFFHLSTRNTYILSSPVFLYITQGVLGCLIGFLALWGQNPAGAIIFFNWKFATRSADRSAEPSEKKASGQNRWESHFHAGSAFGSCQRCHFLLTNHIPKDILSSQSYDS